MPKVIQPRRHDKDLNVEDFWKIREEGKIQKSISQQPHVYREEEVLQRHRYQKPSDKAKTFNPLALMLRRQNRGEVNELYTVGDDDQNTCIGEYLSGVMFIVTSALKEIKRYTMGRKSIVYNIQKIYQLLWESLQFSESWPLLQAVIKDVRGERFDLWLSHGFKKLAETATEIINSTFQQTFFRNLFNTLCMVLEHFYNSIVSNLKQFFIQFGTCFFKHSNKYIRKFSVQSFSYILSNLESQQYDDFMTFLVDKQNEGFFDSQIKLAHLLVQRLRIVRGSLTTASLTHFLDQIQTLASIFYSQGQQNSQTFVELVSEYILFVLSALNNKQGGADDKILFDFNYTVKALINFAANNKNRYNRAVVLGFSKFIALYRTDKKKFTANVPQHTTYMAEMWQNFAIFFKQNVQFFEQSTFLYDAMAVLILKCSSLMYYDSQIINYCKMHNESVESIIKVVYESESQVEKGLMQVVLLLSKEYIRSFFIDDQKTELIYILMILLKRTSIKKLVQISWLDVTSAQISNKIKRAKIDDDLIVALRMMTFINFQADQLFCNQLEQLQTQTLGQYEDYMTIALQKERQDQSQILPPSQFFNSSNFIKQIILNSHHQIKWLSHIFNLYEAFSIAFQHLSKLTSIQMCANRQSVWNQLIISRPSAIDILRSNGYLSQSMNNNDIVLNLLASRKREVRYSSLKVIHQQLDPIKNSYEIDIIGKLMQIDQNQIELENQREVKRIFCLLEQEMTNFNTSLHGQSAINLLSCLIKWSLGFAFTGFKLIQKSFVTFFSSLISIPLLVDRAQTVVQTLLMPFLQYYNYRHSRQYEFDLSTDASSSHLANAFQIQMNEGLMPFIKEDFQLADLETVEWIGLERVAEAVKNSKKGKQNLGQGLNALVKAYFEIEFTRQKRSIESTTTHNLNISKSFLLPIKQRFLITILKLCPTDYLPPFNCLHFTREQFFQLPAVKAIKKNNWQAMWQKKKNDNPKKKIQISQSVSTTVNLQHLGPQQRQMYLCYLWKDILQANRHKKRIIFDHIKNYLPLGAGILIHMLFEDLHLADLQFQHSNEQLVTTVVNRLKLLNRKSLLNDMFIMKSILLHLRQEVNNGNNLKVILVFILAIIQIVYDYSSVEAVVDEEDEQDNKDEEDHIEEEDVHDSDAENGEKEGNSFEYKQHRKQLQKLLQTLFSNHQLQPETITELLHFLLVNSKINISKATRLSLPGLLIIWRIISNQKQYCLVLSQVMDGQIIKMLCEMIQADEIGARPLKVCSQVWINIMENLLLEVKEKNIEQTHNYQTQIDSQITAQTSLLIPSILSYINSAQTKHEPKNDKPASKRRKDSPEGLKLLKIISKLFSLHTAELDSGWEKYIWEELSKITKLKKNLSGFHCERLSLLIVILTRYINLKPAGLQGESKNFLRRVIGVLPNIKEAEQRQQITNLMIDSHKEMGLSLQIVNLVGKLGQLKKSGLTIEMDYTSFFQASNTFIASISTFNLIDHEYFLHNLLCYIDSEQLSIRRAVSSCSKQFLDRMSVLLTNEMKQQTSEQKNENLIMLVLKIYRVLLDNLSRQSCQQNQSTFWNIVDNISMFFTWISDRYAQINETYPNNNSGLYKIITTNQQQNYFKLLGSLSEAQKLKGLKTIKITLQAISAQNRHKLMQWPINNQIDIPNPFSKIMLPILEYLIMQPTEKQVNRNNTVKGNLTSTLSLISLELLPLMSGFMKPALIKKELKRLVVKLKFNQAESKKNMAIVKMMGQIIDGVAGERVNQKMKSYIEEHGFDKFHNKITEATRQAVHEHFAIDSSDDQKDEPNKREKIPGYFERLEQLEQDEAINRNFLNFDKKMMAIEEQVEGEPTQTTDFPRFLRKQILLPLRTMLMMESKGKMEQQQIKGRVLLSVTVTKVLLRLPLQLFLRQFQKVISRLGRLLKKKVTQIRQNSRSCLCEIAKAVGAQLLYAIILQLKFHLRDNFDKHVFNYSLYRIMDSMTLQSGDIDYCLPLVLPMIIDEVFGQSAMQKQMVEKGQVPTLKMQAKKRKGLDLLQLLCRYISHNKLGYIIQFLEKYLREHLVTQVNLGKYDQMLGSISAGLSANAVLMDSIHAHSLLPALTSPVTKLRQQIKILNFEDKVRNQNTVKREWNRQKAGKKQSLTLQEEAGRNGSIFKKMSKQIGERRNQQIIASSLVQFYLVLLSLFIRKQVFTLASTTATSELANQILTLLGFLSQCIDHRDNRLVAKSLKILHLALNWNSGELKGDKQAIGDRFKSLKKQTSRKILLLIEQLTLADEQLLKECFTFLNDLLSEATLSIEMLPNIVAIIKLHTPTSADQPHLSQTYRLMRTILYKSPLHLYNNLLDDLHKMVRMQIVTCHNKQIRQLCKNILAIYLRPKKDLDASIEAFNIAQKKQGNKGGLTYQKRLQQQITYYLSNLQSTGQDAVLELLEEFVDNREPTEIEQYGQLLCLGLMTARTNQVQNDKEHPTDKLVIKVLSRLDQNKIITLTEKCLLWMKQERMHSVRLCGASLLRIILQNGTLKLNKHVIQRYILNEGGLLELFSSILQSQVKQYQSNKQIGQSHKKLDQSWNAILNKMDIETAKYQFDPSVFEVLLQITILLQKTQIASSGNKYLSEIICSMWKLLHYKSDSVVGLLSKAMQKVLLLPILVSYTQKGEKPFYNDRHSFSFKKTLAALIFNLNDSQIIQQLFKKLMEEENRLNMGSSVLVDSSWFLVCLGLKAHVKSNIYQQSLPIILYLISSLTLNQNINNLDCRQFTLAIKPFQQKMLELTVKLSANDLISHESKTLNQQNTDSLKQCMGVGEYFKAVGQFQTRRRDKKQSQRTRMAELAITNPQQYFEQKRNNKKRKL